MRSRTEPADSLVRVPSYLEQILVYHRARAAAGTVELGLLEERAAKSSTGSMAPRDFRGALTGALGGPDSMGGPCILGDARARVPAVIAEIKRRSPSKGDLAGALDPGLLAEAYSGGGAACLSVLTDEPHFGGSAADLSAARAAVELPVLRKDFLLCRADIYESRVMGADAVLLIVAALEAAELEDLHNLTGSLGMAALVEVHDEQELERALGAGATLVGVNQRDLVSFEVDTARAVRVREAIPSEVVAVAESGISSHEDLIALARAGFDAVLVGEALVTSKDPAAALERLRLGGPVAVDPERLAPTSRRATRCQ